MHHFMNNLPFIKNEVFQSVCRFLIRLLLLVFCFNTYPKAESFLADAPLIFENFSSQNLYHSEGMGFYVDNLGRKLYARKGVLVKVEKDFDLSLIEQLIDDVESLDVIYKGFDFNYVRIELGENAFLIQSIAALQASGDFLLVQPDILQISGVSNLNREFTVSATNGLNGGSKLSQHGDHADDEHNHSNRRNYTGIIDPALLNVVNRPYQSYVEKIGIPNIWKSTLGKGVKVAIIDDGFDLSHSGLGISGAISTFDVDKGKLMQLPRSLGDQHGTKLTGIIFSKHSKSGLKGIAPEADFIGIRSSYAWTSHTLLALEAAKSAGADVVNCSWRSPWLLEPIKDAVEDFTRYGREGKGALVVFAAGNQGEEILPNSAEGAIESAFVVGAHNLRWQKLHKSNYGKTVDANSFGMRVATTGVNNQYGNLSGTSLSAAIVSGLSALLIAQNPNLTGEEVQNQLLQILSDPTLATNL